MLTYGRHGPFKTLFLSNQLYRQSFFKAFATAENEGAEVIVVKSAKPGVYTAGLDISELYKPEESQLRSYSDKGSID